MLSLFNSNDNSDKRSPSSPVPRIQILYFHSILIHIHASSIVPCVGVQLSSDDSLIGSKYVNFYVKLMERKVRSDVIEKRLVCLVWNICQWLHIPHETMEISIFTFSFQLQRQPNITTFWNRFLSVFGWKNVTTARTEKIDVMFRFVSLFRWRLMNWMTIARSQRHEKLNEFFRFYEIHGMLLTQDTHTRTRVWYCERGSAGKKARHIDTTETCRPRAVLCEATVKSFFIGIQFKM